MVLAMPDDIFLLSGQSNMWGHSTSDESIEPGVELFEDTLTLEGSALIDRIDLAQRNELDDFDYDPQVAVRTAAAVADLKERGVLDSDNSVLHPLPNAFCVLNSGEEVPLEAYAECGGEFGVELTMAHSLSRQQGPETRNYATPEQPLHMRKASEGGKLVTDFLPGGDVHQQLLDVLDGAPATGAYRAFVWYQGENDVFEETTTENYVESFLELVDMVTTRMYQHGVTATEFPSPNEIPVLVVQLGYWPGPRGFEVEREQIDLAHEQVVESMIEAGRPAVLVGSVSQYSRFYHLDAPTLLILGDVLAQEYLALAEPVTSSPTDIPTHCSRDILCFFLNFWGWILSHFGL